MATSGPQQSTSLTIRDDKTLVIGSFLLHGKGLTVQGTPTFEEWESMGQWLSQAEGAVHFWLGDWVKYGEQRWGDQKRVAHIFRTTRGLTRDKYPQGVVYWLTDDGGRCVYVGQSVYTVKVRLRLHANSKSSGLYELLGADSIRHLTAHWINVAKGADGRTHRLIVERLLTDLLQPGLKEAVA